MAEAVRTFVNDQDELAKKQIQMDFRKLMSRGLAVSEPLVKHLEDDIWYLRSSVGTRLFRTFYFRCAERGFHAFYTLQKDQRRLSNRQLASIREANAGAKRDLGA